MVKNNSTSPRKSRISLDVESRIEGANKLYTKLKKCAARGADVELIGGDVEVIDSSALQLLVVFIREVRANGHTVFWASVSEPLYHIATLSGLVDELGLGKDHS